MQCSHRWRRAAARLDQLGRRREARGAVRQYSGIHMSLGHAPLDLRARKLWRGAGIDEGGPDRDGDVA